VVATAVAMVAPTAASMVEASVQASGLVLIRITNIRTSTAKNATSCVAFGPTTVGACVASLSAASTRTLSKHKTRRTEFGGLFVASEDLAKRIAFSD
jgi:hypothetical protein